MKKNGFAITGIIYAMFLLFIVMLLGNLSMEIMISKNNDSKASALRVKPVVKYFAAPWKKAPYTIAWSEREAPYKLEVSIDNINWATHSENLNTTSIVRGLYPGTWYYRVTDGEGIVSGVAALSAEARVVFGDNYTNNGTALKPTWLTSTYNAGVGASVRTPSLCYDGDNKLYLPQRFMESSHTYGMQLLVSTDYGATWNQTIPGLTQSNLKANYRAMDCIKRDDTTTVFWVGGTTFGSLLGGNQAYPNLIFKRINQDAWQTITLPTDNTGGIWDIDMVTEQVGYAASWSRVYKTTDGWSTWNDITGTAVLGSQTNLYFINENYGYIGNTSGSTLGRAYRTINGGVTWTEVPVNGSGYNNGIHFLTPEFGFIGTFQTVNGGESWTNRTTRTYGIAVNAVGKDNFHYDWSSDATRKIISVGQSGSDFTNMTSTFPVVTFTFLAP